MATRTSVIEKLSGPEDWLEEVRIMWITPAIAKEMLAGNEGNRPKSDGHMERYSEDMADGVWFVNGGTISFCDDERYPLWGRLMDGQTRLEACIARNEPFRTLVLLHADPRAWDTIDMGRRRSLPHILAMHKYEKPLPLSVAARLLVRWESRTLMAETPPTANQVLRWLEGQDVEKIYESIRLANILRRKQKMYGFVESVSAAFHYVINIHEPELSDKFHDELMTGLGLTENSGTYRLLKWTGEKKADREHPTQVARLAYTVKAWNAWVVGESISNLSWRGAGHAAEDFPKLLDRHGNVIRKRIPRRRSRSATASVAPGFKAMDREVFSNGSS